MPELAAWINPLLTPPASSDELRDACGVFGIYAPGRPVAYLTYDGLYALQHRGQESAGMAVSDGEAVTVVRDMGLVVNVFDERTLKPLQGDLAVGHVRYSTTGSSTWDNAQPVFRSGPEGTGFALGHNGNLTNTAALAEEAGMLPGTVGSDSDLVIELLNRNAVMVPASFREVNDEGASNARRRLFLCRHGHKINYRRPRPQWFPPARVWAASKMVGRWHRKALL